MRVCFDLCAVRANFICTSYFVAYVTPWYRRGFGNIGFMKYCGASNSTVKVWVYLCYTHTQKQKKKKSVYQLLYFGAMFLNGISLDFCKKPKNVHFDLNSVFSLSYKISYADLMSLFMERITLYIYTVIVISHHVKKTKNRTGSCLLIVRIDFLILIWLIDRNLILKNQKKLIFLELI